MQQEPLMFRIGAEVLITEEGLEHREPSLEISPTLSGRAEIPAEPK
jgi:hypothetical protein